MRVLVIVAAIVAGVIVVSGVVAAADNGRDNSGETVRASKWADDVCGTVGAWQGQLKDIREEMRKNRFALRQNDGGSGDSVEGFVTVREAVNRAIRATEDTLQEGLKRAGIPDASSGTQASAVLRDWANRTERNLRIAKAQVRQKPTSVSEAFASLVPPLNALARSTVDGRLSFRRVAALDPELSDALNGSGTCRRMREKRP